MPKKLSSGLTLPILILAIVVVGLLVLVAVVFLKPKSETQTPLPNASQATLHPSNPNAKQSQKPKASTGSSAQSDANPTLSSNAFSSRATQFSLKPPAGSEVDEEPTTTGTQITITPPLVHESSPYTMSIQISKTTADTPTGINSILVDKGYRVTDTTVAEQPAKRYTSIQTLNNIALHSIITIFFANNKHYYIELQYATQTTAANQSYETVYADMLGTISL